MDNIVKFPQLSESDKQFLELKEQKRLIEEQKELIEQLRKAKDE
jgi:hypothetical protein